MAGGKEFWENMAQYLDFAGGHDELFINITSGVHLVFNTLEQEGMLTNLAELHELVAETFYTTRFSV